jgi:flagellar basal-body rod protein FlgC
MSVDPVAISRSALDVEWQRLQLIAQNLANENTAVSKGAGTYRPLRLQSGPAGAFERIVEQGGMVSDPQGVQVLGVAADVRAPRRVYDPRNPAADSSGFVAYPAVDHAIEMTELVKTARAYESNLTVMSLAEQMAMRALDIGKR